MSDYTVWCDGGCTGNPGPMYGSYQISTKNNKRLQRLKFGNGTNNKAEYLALIYALTDIVAKCRGADKSPKLFTVTIYTDSQLVVKQLNDEWGCHNEELLKLRDNAKKLLVEFGDFAISWQPRNKVVSILGH